VAVDAQKPIPVLRRGLFRGLGVPSVIGMERNFGESRRIPNRALRHLGRSTALHEYQFGVQALPWPPGSYNKVVEEGSKTFPNHSRDFEESFRPFVLSVSVDKKGETSGQFVEDDAKRVARAVDQFIHVSDTPIQVCKCVGGPRVQRISFRHVQPRQKI
jgi:hypothetical protein